MKWVRNMWETLLLLAGLFLFWLVLPFGMIIIFIMAVFDQDFMEKLS